MCLATMLASYASNFPGVLFSDFMRYAIGAGGVYLIVNLALAGRLAGRKIRPRTPPFAQIRREIWASLRTVFVFAAVGTTIGLGAAVGVLPIYTDIAAFGWGYFVFSTVVLIVAHDAYFYWMHRLIHRRGWFRHVHRTHHRSVNPTPFTSYSFDTAEAALTAVYLPLILVVLPAHPIAILIFTAHMMVRNAIGHCGYELFPAGRDGRPMFDWMTTVTHHDLHHAEFRWNYGLYFTWWDRWMGTEHPDYYGHFERAAVRRHGPASRSLRTPRQSA